MSQRQTLDPKLDVVFKMLFGRLENRGLLIALLDAVLRPASPIRSVEVEAEISKGTVDDKDIALDLRVELEDGQLVNVEMQTQPRPARRERALYYWARMYAGQLGRGDGYQDLCRCVVVLIVPFVELQGDRFHSTFRVREVHDQQDLSDQLEVHVVELAKLGTPGLSNDEPALVNWGKFLSATSDEQLEELAMTDPVLRQAKDALDRLSADPDARVLAEMRDMAQKSYQLDLARVHKQGKEEGKAEGKAEGYSDFLLQLLATKFGALPPAVTQRVQAATLTELQRWATRLLNTDALDAVFEE